MQDADLLGGARRRQQGADLLGGARLAEEVERGTALAFSMSSMYRIHQGSAAAPLIPLGTATARSSNAPP
jgi:hypothetical protein